MVEEFDDYKLAQTAPRRERRLNESIDADNWDRLVQSAANWQRHTRTGDQLRAMFREQALYGVGAIQAPEDVPPQPSIPVDYRGPNGDYSFSCDCPTCQRIRNNRHRGG